MPSDEETALTLENLDAALESMRTFERNYDISFLNEERRIIQILSRDVTRIFSSEQQYFGIDAHNNISLERYISDIESSKTK